MFCWQYFCSRVNFFSVHLEIAALVLYLLNGHKIVASMYMQFYCFPCKYYFRMFTPHEHANFVFNQSFKVLRFLLKTYTGLFYYSKFNLIYEYYGYHKTYVVHSVSSMRACHRWRFLVMCFNYLHDYLRILPANIVLAPVDLGLVLILKDIYTILCCR